MDDERGGTIKIAGASTGADAAAKNESGVLKEPEFYGRRVNNGEDLSFDEAVNACAERWRVTNDNKEEPTTLDTGVRNLIFAEGAATRDEGDASDEPLSVNEGIKNSIQKLQVDDEEYVAKVCPGRIYSMTFHPTKDAYIVSAGDKEGYIGFWKHGGDPTKDQRTLVRPHTSPVSCLQWVYNNALLSTSYDGTVRLFDVESGSFQEVFAAYNDDSKYETKAGFGIDTGSNFWVQHGCAYGEDLFLSTSTGRVLHIDRRAAYSVLFSEELSEKKINTVSLHPDGNTLVFAGLDCVVKAWDLRKLKRNKPLALYDCGRSVNSAFHSCTGDSLVCTTMANRLEILDGKMLSMNHSIRHDNKTGRWLTTIQAIFHPTVDDIFAVGSMAHPRCAELFHSRSGQRLQATSGDALTAVVSRLAFHPRNDEIVFAGGNGSGRVTIFKEPN